MQNSIRFRNILMNKESIRDLDNKKRKQVLSRILSDLEETSIFKDIEIDDSDEYFIEDLSDDLNSTKKTPLDEDICFSKKQLKDKNVQGFIYGRTPLHQAIADKDIKTIQEYANEKKYIFDIDNNGNTPYDMAYQEGYEEAISVLKKYI